MGYFIGVPYEFHVIIFIVVYVGPNINVACVFLIHVNCTAIGEFGLA